MSINSSIYRLLRIRYFSFVIISKINTNNNCANVIWRENKNKFTDFAQNSQLNWLEMQLWWDALHLYRNILQWWFHFQFELRSFKWWTFRCCWKIEWNASAVWAWSHIYYTWWSNWNANTQCNNSNEEYLLEIISTQWVKNKQTNRISFTSSKGIDLMFT